jgi:hypothetical protein
MAYIYEAWRIGRKIEARKRPKEPFSQYQHCPQRKTHGRNLLDCSPESWTFPGVPINRIHVGEARSHMDHLTWSGTFNYQAPGVFLQELSHATSRRLRSHMDLSRYKLGHNWKLSHAQKARRRHSCTARRHLTAYYLRHFAIGNARISS